MSRSIGGKIASSVKCGYSVAAKVVNVEFKSDVDENWRLDCSDIDRDLMRLEQEFKALSKVKKDGMLYWKKDGRFNKRLEYGNFVGIECYGLGLFKRRYNMKWVGKDSVSDIEKVRREIVKLRALKFS